MSYRPLLLPPLLHHWYSEFWNSVCKHYSHVCLTAWESLRVTWNAYARGSTLAPIWTSPSQLLVFMCAPIWSFSCLPKGPYKNSLNKTEDFVQSFVIFRKIHGISIFSLYIHTQRLLLWFVKLPISTKRIELIHQKSKIHMCKHEHMYMCACKCEYTHNQ